MSFIDARLPSATVSVAKEAVLYAVRKSALHAELEDNVALAARFYKAIATFLSDRVRKVTAPSSGPEADSADELDDSVLDNVDRAGARFDDLSRQLLERGSRLPPPR
jgi:hypothetical protein